MRIAMVSETWLPQINGVSRTLQRLTDYLVSQGDRLLLIGPRYPNPAPRPATVHSLAFPGPALPFYREIRLPLARPARLTGHLRDFTPDVVHIATEGVLGWSALRAARGLSLPVVSSYHTNFPQYLAAYRLGILEPLAWHYLRRFHNRTGLTLCPTPSIRTLLEKRGFANVAVWSRGVDAQRFHPRQRSTDLRRELGIADDEVVLLYVGRLAAEKNLPMLLDAWQNLQGPGRLVLVGDGPLRPELERRNLPGLIFTGYRQGEALARLYASADIFAFPSLSETFGNVILEAMASGLPVVGYAVPGPVDLVADRETGLLCNRIDAPGLAAALQPLVNDAALRRRFGRAARHFAAAREWDAINREVREHYHRLARNQLTLARGRDAVASIPAEGGPLC